MEINSINIPNIIRCIVIKPEKEIPIITEISLDPNIKEENNEDDYSFNINSFEKDIRKILGIENNEQEPLFSCLADPLQDFVLILNPEMLNNDSEYNFGYAGTPLFGNVIIIQTKIDENQKEADDNSIVTKVISMEEKVAEVLQTFFGNNKELEKKSGVYDSIVNEIKQTSKKDFIRNILNDNIEAGNYEEK